MGPQLGYLARREAIESEQRDLVVGLNLVVVGGVGERQRQHALLLQVGLVDPGENREMFSKPVRKNGQRGTITLLKQKKKTFISGMVAKGTTYVLNVLLFMRAMMVFFLSCGQ